MYLLDSILKNIGEPYVSIFSKNIATLFLRAFAAVNADEKASLQRLAGTWPGVFPAEVLSAVQRSLGGAGAHGAAAGPPPPSYGGHVLPGGALPGVSAAGGLPGPRGGVFGAGPRGLPVDQKNLLESLVASGVLTAEPRAPGGAGGLGGGAGAPAAAAEPTGTSFVPEKLRARNEAVLEALYFAQEFQCKTTGMRFQTKADLNTHLDALFARKKRLKEDDPVYRRWYVSLENWMQGIAAAEVDAPNMFDPTAGGGEGEPEGAEPEVSVPVDPDCQRCALSGQKFETFWHEGEDEWHYRGAVRLEAPYGGAAAGSLVHVRCLPSEEGGGSGPDSGAPAAKKARVS